jgi:hypothetical protein
MTGKYCLISSWIGINDDIVSNVLPLNASDTICSSSVIWLGGAGAARLLPPRRERDELLNNDLSFSDVLSYNVHKFWISLIAFCLSSMFVIL